MKIITDSKKIEDIFNRGVIINVLPSKEELIEKFKTGQKLKIYIGADPTSNSLHLSHAKNYMLLDEFRQLGHEVIILVGDFTAQIGDPTGKSDTRKQLSADEVKQNVEDWITQIRPLLNFDDQENPPRVVFNSEWLSKLSFKDVVQLASNFTVQQIMERDMFEKRLNANIPIYLHEFLYPLMQGYDSVALDVDIELCGSDQTFNALAGRTLLKKLKGKDKSLIVVNLMENPETGALMSKSLGTGVFLSSSPNEMYGSIMAQPDEMIKVLFVNCTRVPLEEIEEIMSQGGRIAKARVALEIVKKFYGEKVAITAEESFIETFQRKLIPTNIPEIKLGISSVPEVLIEAGVISSKSEWRRLIQEGAVHTDDDTKISNVDFSPTESVTLKIGKRRFVRLII